MRIDLFRRRAALLALAMLLAGFAYSGLASVRLWRDVLSGPRSATASATVDAYLAPAGVDADTLRRAVAGWSGDRDIVVLAALSEISRQDLQQVYFSIAYLLYPAPVWMATWCDPAASPRQCAAAAASSAEDAAARHRARRIILLGRGNPFPTACVRTVSHTLSLVELQ